MASTHAFFKRYGANRLLKLALILDTADALHNRRIGPVVEVTLPIGHRDNYYTRTVK